MSGTQNNLIFFSPNKVILDLFEKHKCNSLGELHKKIEGKRGFVDDRELFFGSVFTLGIGIVQHHDCLVRLADQEPWDVEIVDNTLLQKGKTPNHFYVQNVHITKHYIENEIKNDNNNIYKIIAKFLDEKKLSPKRGDYKGGLLVFHIGANINGNFYLPSLRKTVREIKQDKFEQIWVTNFSKPDYSEANLSELLKSDMELLKFPLNIFK